MRLLTVKILAVLCLLFTPVMASAQTSTISGTVKDASGGVLPGVTVETASPVLIEKSRSTVTSGSGSYSILALRPGTYTVTFSLPGFGKFKVANRPAREGRNPATGATLTIAAGAVKDEVSLSYNWDGAPSRLEFELEDANMLTKMDGAYILKDLGDETEVTYELSVGVSMPIPQMMVTKQEKTTIDQALAQLKEHCEG